MKKVKENKGITLVALIITIIILLILAGVTINLVIGENGLITKSKQGIEASEISSIKEQAELVKSELSISEQLDISLKFDRKKLMDKLKEEFDGTYQGDRIIIRNGKYVVYVKPNKNLDVEVIKNDGKTKINGELTLTARVNEKNEIYLIPEITGTKKYSDFAKEKMKNKSEQEIEKMFVNGYNYWASNGNKFENFAELIKYKQESGEISKTYNSLIEYYEGEIKNYEYYYESLEAFLIIENYIEPEEYEKKYGLNYISVYDEEENTLKDCLSGEEVLYIPAEKKEYKFYAALGEMEATTSVNITNISIAELNDENIFIFDETTGTIEGIKDEYCIVGECSKRKYLKAGLTSITIPSTINGIAVKKVNELCILNLYSVKIEEGIEELNSTFYDVPTLKSIELPSTLKIIGRYCFFGTALTEVTIPESVQEIGESAFLDTKIQKIRIPINVTKIENGAFGSNNENFKVICAAPRKPSGWDYNWVYSVKSENIIWNDGMPQ